MSDIDVWLDWFDRHNVSMTAMVVTVGLVIGAFAVSALLKRPLQDHCDGWYPGSTFPTRPCRRSRAY